MKIERFEDMIVWKRAQELALNIYILFKDSKDFGFKDQIQRASISISNNISEGFERKGNKEFKYFLFIAKGSSAEVRNMLYIARKLQYVDKDNFDLLMDLAISISKMLSGLIKKL